ncbi:ATP-binding cassette domain-containing protein [Nocardia sp. NPDC020380]|uniref:ATP-binding cassette domain-containing protein n=1 Tax=Nocardia sp. NPDC020380 TaxID=3364309 RepID=UPI0037B4D6B3
MRDVLLEAEGLEKRFGNTRAVAGVDLSVRRGSVVGLLGPNGAGKTTMLRILSTLTLPDAGRATIGGFDVVREATRVRTIIGLAGQSAALDEKISGYENLLMFGRLSHLPERIARARARELLARYDLDEAGNRLVSTYSGGMRRRLDLISSLVVAPQLLFLDEPTTGLDPRSRNEIWSTLRQLVAAGITVLLTTQYLDEADQLADRIVIIDHGAVIAEGTPPDLKSAIGTRVRVDLADPADADAAAAVLSRLSRGRVERDPQGDSISGVCVEALTVPAVVRAFDAAGIPIVDAALHAPSLDEVFLSLTGNPAGAMEASAA